MKRLIPLLLFSTFLCTCVRAQNWSIAIMDEWRSKLYQREIEFDPLLAKSVAEVSTETDAGRLEYLNQSIRPVVVERYAEYTGDPFQYPAFTDGRLRDATGGSIALAPLNYNAHTGRIEFADQEVQLQFIPNFFPSVQLRNPAGNYELLVYGLLPDFANYYSVLAYGGSRLQAAYHLTVTEAENEGYSGGFGTATKRLIPVRTIYAKVDGRWRRVGTKVKQLGKALGLSGELRTYAKRERLDPMVYADLKRIMAYAESLLP